MKSPRLPVVKFISRLECQFPSQPCIICMWMIYAYNPSLLGNLTSQCEYPSSYKRLIKDTLYMQANCQFELSVNIIRHRRLSKCHFIAPRVLMCTIFLKFKLLCYTNALYCYKSCCLYCEWVSNINSHYLMVPKV